MMIKRMRYRGGHGRVRRRRMMMMMVMVISTTTTPKVMLALSRGRLAQASGSSGLSMEDAGVDVQDKVLRERVSSA
jgi:hypothetical protein